AGISKDFVDRMLSPYGGDPSGLFPNGSRFGTNIVSARSYSGISGAPIAPGAARSGSNITWSNSPSADVVGYYVYKDGVKIASVAYGGSYSAGTSAPGSYSVRAVDITGQLSGPSNVITTDA